MGVITISISDDVEKKLRKLARAKFSVMKGHLSMAITEALEEWAGKRKEDVVAKSLELLEKGIDMGGIISKKRENLHVR